MALPASGPLSLNAIKTEFNGVNPIAMNAYYRGGAYTTSNNTSVPTSGAISISNFYGASNTVGTTWTQAATYTLSTIDVFYNYANKMVAYGNGKYVAVGSGTYHSAYSSDGDTWTISSALNSLMGTPYSVTFLNGSFVALAFGSSSAAKSTDGVNWTGITISASGVPQGTTGITWNGTNFITGSTTANRMLTSPDLAVWTARNPPFSANALESAFSKLYAIDAGYIVYFSSDSGATWSSTSLASLLGWSTSTTLLTITYNGTILLVTGFDSTVPSSGAVRAAKFDGTTWTDMSSYFNSVISSGNRIWRVIWGGANWVMSLNSGAYVYTSLNLQTITNAPTATSAVGASYTLSGLATNGSGQVVATAGFNSGGSTQFIKSP